MRSNLCFDFQAVLLCALAAWDLGDLDSARALARAWDGLRTRIGLPVPVHLIVPAGEAFGLEPAAPPGPDPDYRWDEVEIRQVIAKAAAWCRRVGDDST
ncbi:MAG TPA: hypothetical protein VI076_00565 [Actinopolymorphaceae bacterium]